MYTKLFSNLVIKDIYSANTIYTSINTGAKRTNRNCWSICMKYEGKTEYSFKNKKVISDINHIIILPKGCDYSWKCINPGHFSFIEFESDLTYPEPICISTTNGKSLLKKMKEFEYRHNQERPLRELKNIRDVYSILLSVLESEAKSYSPSKKQQKIAPALEYISLHYTERITNDALASVSSISTVYFRKLFSEIMGVSPITYINNFKISKAKEMLESDYGSLSNLAMSLGYPDLYTFSKDFKKIVGVSPSNYVKQNMSSNR